MLGRLLQALSGLLLYVFCPLDIAVCRICQITKLEDQKNELPGEHIDDTFKNRTDVPGYPLLAVSHQNKNSVADPDSRYTGIQIADDVFKRYVSMKKIRCNIKRREKISDEDRPYKNSNDNKHLNDTGEPADLGEFSLLSVRMAVPGYKADYVDRKPEKKCRCHGGKSICAHHTNSDFCNFNKNRNNKIPLALLGNQQFTEDVQKSIQQVQSHDNASADAISVFLREYKCADDCEYQNAEEPAFFISCKKGPDFLHNGYNINKECKKCKRKIFKAADTTGQDLSKDWIPTCRHPYIRSICRPVCRYRRGRDRFFVHCR